jgi:hypothetical protein
MPMNTSSWSASRLTCRRPSAARMPDCITRAASSLATTCPAAMRCAASALLRLALDTARARSRACGQCRCIFKGTQVDCRQSQMQNGLQFACGMALMQLPDNKRPYQNPWSSCWRSQGERALHMAPGKACTRGRAAALELRCTRLCRKQGQGYCSPSILPAGHVHCV